MAISRMQQPRQMYGLGSLVKSITKGVKSAVKGVTGAVKDNPLLAAAALNFAPMLAGAKPFFGLGLTEGRIGLPSFLSAGVDKFKEMGDFGKTATIFAGGSLLAPLLGQAEEEGDPEGITRNVGALRTKLADAYRNQRTFADAENEEAAIAQQVERDVSEYTAGSGYTNVQESGSFATGGRVGLAMGTPEDKAIQASGIMNLPLNQNPAGVTELDLRESGGFIPPVGVKEKADDIPAMLSNNEFVFTADAVRNMGDGNVNKGAQRMYDFMKYLENGGRV